MAVKKTKSKRAKPRKPSQHRKKKAVKAATRTKKKKALKGKRRRPQVKGKPGSGTLVGYGTRGLGARSGGQSGDTQGLAASPDVDSESVEELIEEGQAFEAEVLDGIENVPDPDEGEVRTKEVPEEDVPEEYQKPDRD
jgi:hypothetical protein